MTLKLGRILSAIAALLVIAGIIYYKGGEGERAHQATEQVKHDKKVRKANDKIDKATPFDADKRHAIDWMYQYGRQQ